MRSRRHWLLGSPDGAISLPLAPVALGGTALLILACLALSALALRSGSLALDGSDLLQALRGEADARTTAVLLQWRLPRIVLALALGAALAASGAIFQSLIRNPLGSPDLIGFGSGAYSGALLVLLCWPGAHFLVAAGAIAGGLGAAALVYTLAWRRGLHGLRLVLVGIAVSALLGACNTWLGLRTSVESAMDAALWGAGSLNGVGWNKGLPSLLVIAVALAAALLLQRRARLLEMGDASAAALGVPVAATRRWLLLLGVVLTAAATAASGPIAFIALAAPPIARALCGPGVGLLRTALIGALLLLGADIAAQHLFAPRQLPVGLITTCLGGLYLCGLLLRQSRRG